MNCPKCGKQTQPGAAFCMHCGQALAAGHSHTGPAHPTQAVPRPSPFAPSSAHVVPAAAMAAPAGPVNLSDAFEQQRRKNRMAALIFGCLAALLAGGFTLRSMGFLGAGGQTPEDKLLLAQGKAPGGDPLAAVGKTPDAPLAAVGNGPDAPLAAAGDKPAEMPDDIYQWLEHLRKSEDKRNAITMSQLTTAYTEKEKSQVAGGVDALKDLLNGIDDGTSEMHPPTEKLAQVIKQMHDDCLDVLKYFDSVPPPQECIPIRDAYDQALNEEAAQMGDIADHLAAGDVEKLLKMEGKSAEGIDSAGAKTDRLVGEICDKYHKRRWFDIASDIKSSPIFGSGF